MMTGTLRMQGIIRPQGWAPWDWFVFRNPFTFVAFFLYFTTALAEGNRTPFDLPEAESELVAGYSPSTPACATCSSSSPSGPTSS